MKTIAYAIGPSLFVVFFASSSMAQVQRTFVSGLGNDGNPCTRTAPCRTLTQAVSQTSAGGEVVVLDSAGYGPFSINKSVSIIAPPGVYAGITVFSGDGIEVNTASSETVILRGLTVNSQGGTGNGITFTTGGTLHVENCVVNGFSGAGLAFNGSGKLEVKDSTMRGNTYGIVVEPDTGTVVAAIDQVRLEGNTAHGLLVTDGAKVTVRDSTASTNSLTGYNAASLSSAPAELNIENCIASNNGTGIHAISTNTGVATVRVSNSTITNNTTGLVNAGGPALLLSRGNNTVEGNGTDTSGTIGSYSAK